MTAEAAPALKFAHRGRFFNVLGLAAKNAALTIATLTLYRFWARTSMRRRLWSRTVLLDDPLEYTGTAGELVRGFLLALPSFFVPAVFVFYIAPFALDPLGAAWLTFGFYVLAVPLIAAARYWMRRYQLSRTRWRGIRLGLVGSAWSFAFASTGWTVLQTLSLGWYTPLARMNRARFIWSNTRFGDQPFEFIDDGAPPQQGLWWPFALGWFSFPIAVGLATATSIGLVSLLISLGIVPHGGESMTGNVLTGAFTVILTLVFMVGCWAPYNAAAMNRIATLISLDGARFRLWARSVSLFAVSLAGWAMIVLSLGLLAPMAGYLQVHYVMNRLEMINAPKFSEIGQSIVSAPAAGEGLGDAFDLDMGVGIV